MTILTNLSPGGQQRVSHRGPQYCQVIPQDIKFFVQIFQNIELSTTFSSWAHTKSRQSFTLDYFFQSGSQIIIKHMYTFYIISHHKRPWSSMMYCTWAKLLYARLLWPRHLWPFSQAPSVKLKVWKNCPERSKLITNVTYSFLFNLGPISILMLKNQLSVQILWNFYVKIIICLLQ